MNGGSRRAFRVPVRVWGVSRSGDAFFQQAHTVDVGLLGALLEGLAHEVAAGEVLGVEYGNSRARFTVVWVGQSGTSDVGKVELSPLDKTEDFWGLLSPVATEQPKPDERRLAKRYACKGSSSLRQPETPFPLGAAVTDISLNGCYVELMTTLPVGTKVDMVLQVAGMTVNCAATVRTSHPGVGMGMIFEPMSKTERGALERAIARLDSAK
jgi:hypothetical protein